MKKITLYSKLKCWIVSGKSILTASPADFADEIIEYFANENDDLAKFASACYGESCVTKLQTAFQSTEWHNGQLYGTFNCEVVDDWTDTDSENFRNFLTELMIDEPDGIPIGTLTIFRNIKKLDEFGRRRRISTKIESDIYFDYLLDEVNGIMTETEMTM